MKLFLRLIFIISVNPIFVSSCASIEPMSKEEMELNQEIKKLRDLYAPDFKDKEAVFEGIKVYRKNTVMDRQIHSVSYYYTNASGGKIDHGMGVLYRGNEIIMEGMYSNGMPNYYRILKLPKKTLQVIFKEGKPNAGILALPSHNGEFLGIDFKNGMPLKATLYAEDGTVKEIVFDVSKGETRNGQPWDGEFLSLKNKKIEKYAEGNLVSSKDCEKLGFIEQILGTFKKNSQ